MVFWERYWKAARLDGVTAGKEVWHERAVWGFIRFLRPRRLAEVQARDVTDWLTLVASQPTSEGWRVQQASRALRILYQRVLPRAWATPWPAGFIGENLQGSWLESNGRPDGVPVPLGEGEVRRQYGHQLEKAVRALRLLHYSYRTEEAYLSWAVRFLRYCGGHPAECIGAELVRDFLEDLAVRGKVAASTQNQALNALVFFFREGLGRELGQLGRFEPAKRPRRLPVVLTAREVGRLLEHLQGECRLMAKLLYGCGLRLMESGTDIRTVQKL
ncbi:MAG: phage integrase N-terminal SAM-like domain-containing protein, partial [Proteobacteria bacterium]|nr:phage integrase N-terminal SAM-like domain-containing protein [Pseudomonadota bacterium]